MGQRGRSLHSWILSRYLNSLVFELLQNNSKFAALDQVLAALMLHRQASVPPLNRLHPEPIRSGTPQWRSFPMINRHNFLLTFSLVVVVLLFVGTTAMAQSTATLQGTVRDQKGGVVPGAKVTAKNQGTGIERTTQTDSEGNYQFAALPVGNYSVEVEAQRSEEHTSELQ